MFILRIELAESVYYNVNLGEAYIKVADVEDCDPDYCLGDAFHDVLTDMYNRSEDFIPNTVIFRKGQISSDNLVDFSKIFGKAEYPKTIRCWVMNDKGDTVESISVTNICDTEEEEPDDYESFTIDDNEEN